MCIPRNARGKTPLARGVRADAISVDVARNIADTRGHYIRVARRSSRRNMRCNDNAMRSQERLRKEDTSRAATSKGKRVSETSDVLSVAA